jgi:hypothetical protein
METVKTIGQVKNCIGRKIRKAIWDLQVIGFSDEEIARIAKFNMYFVKIFLTDDYATNGLYSLNINIIFKMAINLGIELKIE